MSIKELQKISREIAPFVLVLAIWAIAYGSWVLGPALGTGAPVNKPFGDAFTSARVGLMFALTGFLIFLGWIWRDPTKVAAGSAIAALLFGFLFGAFAMTMPYATAVPSYFAGTLLSLAVCRATLKSVLRVVVDGN